jgi:formate hydrogenlyase subunit 6/NADH:ubiquinone oxidoreductase subunit I
MRYPKLRELKEAIKALIKGPYTSRYPYEAHQPFKNFRGRPYFSQDDCTGCTACAQVCPAGAIEFEDKLDGEKPVRILTVHWDICIFCGQCQANCLTEKGIMLSREFAFATTEKREELKQVIEKELILCECCGEPVVPYDQYGWVGRKIGPLLFSNSSLLLFYLKKIDLALKKVNPAKPKEESGRAGRVKILCPCCRREAVIKS